jgi:hypothetical protein
VLCMNCLESCQDGIVSYRTAPSLPHCSFGSRRDNPARSFPPGIFGLFSLRSNGHSSSASGWFGRSQLSPLSYSSSWRPGRS